MIQLVYVSSTKGLLTAEGIAELLATSRDKNQLSGITGILLYTVGNVLQVIEGEEEQVLALFDVIKEDPRHTGVIRLYQQVIRERDFPEWSMAFRSISAESVKIMEGFSRVLDPDFDVRSLKPSAARAMLAMFKESSR